MKKFLLIIFSLSLLGFAAKPIMPIGTYIVYPLYDANSPLNKNVISWWLYYPKLSGGGLTLRDLYGKWHATLSHSSMWKLTSRRGGFGEINFNGSTNYFTMPGSATAFSFPNTTAVISFKFKTTTTATQQYLLAEQLVAATQGGWVLRLETTALLHARILDVNNSRVVSRNSTSTISTNTWYSITLVLKTDTTTQANNDVSIYINNVLDQSSVTNGANPYSLCGCDLTVGIQADHTSSPFSGSIDDIRIYKSPISIPTMRKYDLVASLGYYEVLNTPSKYITYYRTATAASGNTKNSLLRFLKP